MDIGADHDRTEEPGLGKTLECIALILLNPGIGRNPTVVRWDPEAKVEVKQIKVSIILFLDPLSHHLTVISSRLISL